MKKIKKSEKKCGLGICSGQRATVSIADLGKAGIKDRSLMHSLYLFIVFIL